MLSLLSSFLNTVISLVSFFVNSIQSIIDLLTKFPTYISYIVSGIGFTPTLIQPFLLASLFLYTVFFIINRWLYVRRN